MRKHPLTYLSKYFTWREATTTNTGIPNNPDTDEQASNIIHTAQQLDRVRGFLAKPVLVNSWYRNFAVNRAVGGVPTSQHSKGEAVDFRCPAYGSPYEICQAIIASGISFDQLILEPTWVHISFTRHKNQRSQVLTLARGGKYVTGLQPQAQ